MIQSNNQLVISNKKVFYDYFVEETMEAGIVLAGTEVKSIRAGKCSIKESYVKVDNGEIFIYGMNITPYDHGNIFNKEALRPRKLLLHKKEIIRLMSLAAEKGYTIVATKVYLKDGLVKIEIGLAKGKKSYDKRQEIAKRDMKREIERSFCNRSI